MSASWEQVSAAEGGTVTGLAASEKLIFAATPVGVYRSSDRGASWQLPGSAPTVPLASAVGLSPNFEQDRTLFVCGADGLYRSTDVGETWDRVLIGDGMLSVATSRIETDDAVLVLAGTEADGIVRSEDGGRAWGGANAGLVDLTAICLAVSPCFATDRTAFAGTSSGLYRTRNGARSWRAVETGLEDPAVQCLLISPSFSDERLVLAGTEAHGLLRSTDGGNTWQSPPDLSTGGVTALAYGNNVVAAATQNGIALSHDLGATWHFAKNGPVEPALSLAFHGEVLLVGLHRAGVARSVDDGATWRSANEGLSARLDTELSLSGGSTVFVGGLEDGVRVSRDSGSSWNSTLPESAVYSLAASGDELWAAASTGLLVSRDDGLTWQESTSDSVPARVVAVGDGTVLTALETGTLLLSRDDGASWRELHTPAEGASVSALAIAPDKTFLAATTTPTEVTLWRWEDLRGWSRVLVEPSNGVLRVALAVSNGVEFDQGIFVGLGRRVLRPVRHAQEVRQRERRPMWRAASLGPNVVSVTSLAVSPGGRDVLAATNAGVFVSQDGGATFTDWSEGLTNPRLVAIAVSPTYEDDRLIYALGLGGTLWRRMV